MESLFSQRKLSTLTGGVSAIRRHKLVGGYSKVLSKKQYQRDCVLPALLSELNEMRAARDSSLAIAEWEILQSVLVEETTKALLQNGDILEVNGYVVTDFNWFTSNILGKLFAQGWKSGKENKASSFTVSSNQIDEITAMKHCFGGDVDALPQLLEQLRICKRIEVDGGEKQHWFPTFCLEPGPPKDEIMMHNPVRVVRRRFYLNEDYIFPPGYFAELYMKITDLDRHNHEFGLWEDSMKFESLYWEAETEHRIGVYIFVEPSSHFDLIVCSTSPKPRVWNWLNQVRCFIYTLNSKSSSLVKEWCVDPLQENDDERCLQDVFVEMNGDHGIHHHYYFGTSEGSTLVEMHTNEELAAFVLLLERDLIRVRRECTICVEADADFLRNTLAQIESVISQVENLRRHLSQLEGNDSYHVQLEEVNRAANLLEMEVSEKMLDKMSNIE